ncbi:MAG: radical SAM protein [Zestosphaera sp.]
MRFRMLPLVGFVCKPRKELGRVLKKGRPSDMRVGILVPMPYTAAVSSLFMQLAYYYLNSLEGVLAFRYVYDYKEDVVEALDACLSLNNLDVLLVSASFELDYPYLARVLAGLGMLPRRAGTKPLIIVGGLSPTSNPLPLSKIADAVVIGEAEPLLDKLIDLLGYSDSLSKLREEENIVTFPPEGVKKKAVAEDLDSVFFPTTQHHPLDEEPVYGQGLRIEVSRGCRRFCAFCLEGHVSAPFRYRSLRKIEDIVSEGLETSPAKRVIFYSLSFFDVPYAEKLLEKLVSEGVEFSVPSLRPDYLTTKRVELIARGGQKTLTIAPEILVPEISCPLGKCFDVEALKELLIYSVRAGFRHVKLYLMTGFPKEDVGVSVSAVKKLIQEVLRAGVKIPPKFFRLSINLLVPKPWTPFQYLPPQHIKQKENNLTLFQKNLSSKYVEVETYSTDWLFTQAVIGLGDARTSDLIIELGVKGVTIGNLKKLIRELRTDELRYIKEGWKDPPWMKHLDLGINTKYLETRHKILTT